MCSLLNPFLTESAEARTATDFVNMRIQREINRPERESGKLLLRPNVLRRKPVNHQIIAFMSTARVKIIANVRRVTNGNRGNGAVYKF